MDNGITKHFADLDTCVVVIKGVPCHKCTQCEEVVYTLNVGRRLEEIIGNLKSTMAEVAIIQYTCAA